MDTARKREHNFDDRGTADCPFSIRIIYNEKNATNKDNADTDCGTDQILTQDWEEKEARYWYDTDQIRAREDETMTSKFKAMTDPIMQRLSLVLDERETLTAQLKQFEEQYREAKEIIAAEREEKDKVGRAWFRRYDTQPSRQLDSSQQCGYTTDGWGHVMLGLRSPQAGSKPVEEDGNGRIGQPVSTHSSTIIGQVMADLPALGGSHVLYENRISGKDQPTTETVEVPIQLRLDIDPARRFTEETHQRRFDAKPEIHRSFSMSRVNQSGIWDEHLALSREPYHHSSGTHYSPSGLILTTLLQYLTATTPRLKNVQNIPVHISHGNIKYFWWDVRQIDKWTSFLPAVTWFSRGVTGRLLHSAVPVSSLPSPDTLQDSPKTEEELHYIYTIWLLPRINTVL